MSNQLSKKSVIVHGPQACGKTRNGARMAQHFGLRRVLDDWDGHSAYPILGTLVLTNELPNIHIRRQLPFRAAMELLNGPPGYPFDFSTTTEQTA